MKSISINMKFWSDGQTDSTRTRNVLFTWKELKEFSSFLSSNNITHDISLYDFSPNQIVPDSVHIPYPLGEYKKAEKTNIILNHKKDFSFFMMMDCDTFFVKEDYNKLLNLIMNLSVGDVCTFDLAKLEKDITHIIYSEGYDIKNDNWSYAYAGPKTNPPLHHYSGGLGGVYICDTQLLLALNGFDESYVGWGGEDGDMMGRIWSSQIHHTIKPTKTLAPYHLPHFSDWSSEKYSKRFL